MPSAVVRVVRWDPESVPVAADRPKWRHVFSWKLLHPAPVGELGLPPGARHCNTCVLTRVAHRPVSMQWLSGLRLARRARSATPALTPAALSATVRNAAEKGCGFAASEVDPDAQQRAQAADRTRGVGSEIHESGCAAHTCRGLLSATDARLAAICPRTQEPSHVLLTLASDGVVRIWVLVGSERDEPASPAARL